MKIILAILLLMIQATNILAKDFNATDLAKTALDSNCLDYCVDGVCFYLKCGWRGCKIITTPHIKHNLPDLVVSTYNQPGNSPFVETKLLDKAPQASFKIGGGHLDSNKIKFKEVNVIGNPVIYGLKSQKYLCRSNVNPYQPYYLSTLDALLWRSGASELVYPASWIPGQKEVGSWGSIYPRVGFLSQINDVKAAAVIAERALDIVSKPAQPHIYQHTAGTFKNGGKWQMVSPKPQSCTSFGQGEPNISSNEAGQYAWVAWRTYSCCIPGPGKYLSHVITGCAF